MRDADCLPSSVIVPLMALAGFLDAIGFVGFGGIFVASMSADTTLLGVGVADGSARGVLAAGVILAFVIGVFVGSLIRYRAMRFPRASVLALVCVLLIISTALGHAGMPVSCLVIMTLAVGAANAVIERNAASDDAQQPVKDGRANLHQAKVQVAAMPLSAQLLSWFGFVAGAFAGAAAYGFLGIKTLWLAVLFTALLGLWVAISEAAR